MKSQNIQDIKIWLETALVNEELVDFSVKILGNTEKGDGYIGDVVFVNVKGKTATNKLKTYDLVLKCSKRSQTVRDSVPVKETFENEIYLYSDVFPAFYKFQLEKGLENAFDSVPKYYGKFLSGTMEVLVLENLKSVGYKLYDRHKPLTYDHIELLTREYGKWHAISAAMQMQQPEKFQKLAGGIKHVWKKFVELVDLDKLFVTPIDEIYNVIEADITESSRQKLKDFKKQVRFIVEDLVFDQTHFNVITHGDNWNNNFMFKYEETDDTKPVKVAILDWQISRLSSPVTDLSYFLYACISEEDLNKFDDILKKYYKAFSIHLRKLGGDPDKIFPYSDLLADWKVFGKFGFLMTLLVVKIALSDKDEVQDIAEVMEGGQDFSNTFSYEIKNKEGLRDRVLCIVEHVIKRDFI